MKSPFEVTSSGAADPDFERLVALYYPILYRFALTLSRSEADASDLTQQTFYTWAAKGGQLRDASKVKTWLFTTLHRTFLQGLRRQARFPQQELSEAELDLPRVPAAQGHEVDSGLALASLARLERLYQAPVTLFYLQELSYNEIAEVLGVPLGTVKSRIARGIGQLRELLLPHEAPRPGRKRAVAPVTCLWSEPEAVAA